MKKLVALTFAASLAATSAFAGGAVEPMDEPMDVAPTSSSSGGIIVPLLLLLVIGAAVASGGDDEETMEP